MSDIHKTHIAQIVDKELFGLCPQCGENQVFAKISLNLNLSSDSVIIKSLDSTVNMEKLFAVNTENMDTLIKIPCVNKSCSCKNVLVVDRAIYTVLQRCLEMKLYFSESHCTVDELYSHVVFYDTRIIKELLIRSGLVDRKAFKVADATHILDFTGRVINQRTSGFIDHRGAAYELQCAMEGKRIILYGATSDLKYFVDAMMALLDIFAKTINSTPLIGKDALSTSSHSGKKNWIDRKGGHDE